MTASKAIHGLLWEQKNYKNKRGHPYFGAEEREKKEWAKMNWFWFNSSLASS